MYSFLYKYKCIFLDPSFLPVQVQVSVQVSSQNIEKVQKFALRMCLCQWDCSYNDLLDKAGLPTLRNRRMFLKIASSIATKELAY